MELRHLRYFLTVADERNFMRAAVRLHISQPPLSTQIKDLEHELNVQLFARSNRGVELTTAGEAFYIEARGILARLEHAQIVTQGAARGDVGRLSIGFVSIADYSVLPPSLKRFREQFAGVELQLHEETTDVQVKYLLGRRIDVGFALAPIDEPTLAFEALTKERLMLAVADSHPAANSEKRISLKAVAGEPFILFPRPLAPGLHDAVLAYCRTAGFTPQIAQYATQMQTIVSLVSTGLGVALIPESLLNLRRTGVTYVLPRERSPLVELGLVYRKADGNPALARFLEVAHKAASEISGLQKTGALKAEHLGA